MNTTHQAKRPCAGSHSQLHSHHQSNITSYFFSSQTTVFPNALQNGTSIDQPPSSPALPALVQSNLLSVGMRVRKSVPEGYKTGLSKKHNPCTGVDNGVGVVAQALSLCAATCPPPATFQTLARTRRELTPFCGIMKTGGMAVQGWDYDSSQGDNNEADMPAEDDVPFLSSQGSTISTVSSTSRTSYKRRFKDEEDDEGAQPDTAVYDIWRDADDDVPLSPKMRPVDLPLRQAGLVLGTGTGRRTMAVPRSRRKWAGGVKSAVFEGQENDNGGVSGCGFEEAEFMDWGACL